MPSVLGTARAPYDGTCGPLRLIPDDGLERPRLGRSAVHHRHTERGSPPDLPRPDARPPRPPLAPSVPAQFTPMRGSPQSVVIDHHEPHAHALPPVARYVSVSVD
ncbi:hypothetical protein GCM10020221_21750 [Streptomyces thioluteus]|uniref:Uncharacterized protein n=1 Tax=Streptomyces thioluteus TaxID=66431 RepID=A0ABN3WSQ0_STRTU